MVRRRQAMQASFSRNALMRSVHEEDLTMKAIRFHQIGGPEVLRFEDVELGRPGPGEVRIRHTAVALNFRDILVRRGQHAIKLPSGLGSESAGVIETVGAGVTDLAVGDRVTCVCRPDCAYAEARLAPAARVLKLPDGIDERMLRP